MQSIKHYQDLKGAAENAILVSNTGSSAEELFNGNSPKALVLGISFSIKEISLTGMTLVVPAGISLTEIIEPQQLTLVQSETSFFSCSVVIHPVRPGTALMDVVYNEKGVDLKMIAQKNAVAVAVASALGERTARGENVPASYKHFVADVMDYLADQRSFIASDIAPHENYFSYEEMLQVTRGLEESSESPWQNLLVRGNELGLEFLHEEDQRKPVKEYTERLVTHELVGGKNWHRSFFKPMGYPGDYQIMNYMYDQQPEGNDTYSRYLHSLGLISGRPIVQRMEYISNCLQDLEGVDDNMRHVMSIGSGPAREVQRFLEERYTPGDGYSFTLVDQEEQAIEYAINAAYQSLAPSCSNVVVSALHTSFTEMLRPNSTFRHLPGQHLIYSAGLLDYLNAGLCRRVVKRLYDFLKPGGTLLIGNVNDARVGTYWAMEFVLDWTLFFRNEQEMYDMARDCKDAEVVVDLDSSGAVYMLKLQKPA